MVKITKLYRNYFGNRGSSAHSISDRPSLLAAELEERRLQDERERQEELDKIDWEKFKLQEMEEMER